MLGISPFPFSVPKEIALTAEDRARYVGTYALTRPDGTKNIVRIIDDGGQLLIRAGGSGPGGRSAGGAENQRS